MAFEEGRVLIRVVDDGIGHGSRRSPGTLGFGVGGMRRTMEDVGGTLDVRTGRPRGVIVEARVGREER